MRVTSKLTNFEIQSKLNETFLMNFRHCEITSKLTQSLQNQGLMQFHAYFSPVGSFLARFFTKAVLNIICILRRPHRMEITIAVILSMQPCFSLNIMFQAVRGGGILLRFYSLLAPLTIIKESFFLPLNGRGIPQRYRICTAVFQSGWPSLRSH